MKTVIFRKPKFMRSDSSMVAYMNVSVFLSKLASESDSLEEQYDLLKRAGECLNKAAKAGGFLRTKDFLKWINSKRD